MFVEMILAGVRASELDRRKPINANLDWNAIDVEYEALCRAEDLALV